MIGMDLQPAPRKTIKRTSAAIGAAALAVAFVASSAKATSTSLPDGSWWSSASVQPGVHVIKAFVTVNGGDGGSCSAVITDPVTVPGGKGATVSGTLTLAAGDQLLARLGGAGSTCVPNDAGAAAGGTGVYPGGSGSAAVSISTGAYRGMNNSGGGGGGSTVVYQNNQSPANEVVVAGGGGGAGGPAPKPSAPPIALEGGAGGDASQDGNAGAAGGDWGGTAGTGGAPAPSPSPQTTGLAGQAAPTCETTNPMAPYYCGGAGGNGGGAGGEAVAAIGGAVNASAWPAGAGGGGGAGGSSTGNLGGIQYSSGSLGSGTDAAGTAQIIWANIPTGTVDNADPGAAYTGTAFTVDASPAVASGATWTLLSGAPEGLTIDPTTGQVSGVAPTTYGTHTFNVQVTVPATIEGYGEVELVSVKTITMRIGDPLKPPLRPRELAVKGNSTSSKYKFSWDAPLAANTNRPVVKYRLTVKQRGYKKVIVRKNLPSSQHNYSISRKTLIKHSVLPRGDIRARILHYQVRVKAINTEGVGPISTHNFSLKL